MHHFGSLRSVLLLLIALVAWCGLLALVAGCGSPSQPRDGQTHTVATGNVGRSTIAVDSASGNVYVAWVGTDENDTSNVFLSRLTPDGGTFSAPVRVNDAPGRAAAHAQAPPQVRIGPNGLVYAAWIDRRMVEGRRFPVSDIYLARSSDWGKSFSAATQVNSETETPTSQSFHNLAVGPAGTIYVAWLDSRASDARGTQIRVAASRDGGTRFDTSVVVAEGTCQCCRTTMAVEEDGGLIVGWRHIFGNQIRDMAFAHSTDGGRTFSAPDRLHDDGWQINGCPHSGPSLAVDRRGRLRAIWYTGATGKSGVYHAAYDSNAQSFGEAKRLTADVPVSQVSADSERNGRAWFAWEDHAAGGLKVARSSSPGIMKTVMQIGEGRLPSIAVSGDSWALTWRDDNGIYAHIP